MPTKWRIYLVLYILLFKRDVTRRKAIDQKITNQLKFEEGEQLEQEIDSILDSMVFAKEAVNGRPPRLYYLIYRKKKTHIENTWEPVEKVSYLQRLLKKYYSENLKKPTVAFLPVNKVLRLFQ